MKYRRAAAALLCATLALGLGACSGGSKDKSAQASKMYTWVSNESDRAQWDTFVKGVQETDPNFKLDIEGPSFQDYWTKIKTRMSSADAPCIVTTQAARAQELGELLTPLDDLAKEAGLDLTKYNQAMMQGMTVDGKVRAIPYDAEPMVLFYNKTMFAQAGLKEPGTDYTYEQFLSDAKALTKDGVQGFAVAPDISYPYLPFAFANGNVPVKDGKLNITDPGFVADIQQTFDLVGCEIYTSCEPCPMCLGAIYWAHLDKIYYANDRKDAAGIGFDDDFIYQEIELKPQYRKKPSEILLRNEAIKVFEQWTAKTDKTEY